MKYRYVFSFALGVGPVPSLLLPEIFPNRIRAKAMAVAMCVHWVSYPQYRLNKRLMFTRLQLLPSFLFVAFYGLNINGFFSDVSIFFQGFYCSFV